MTYERVVHSAVYLVGSRAALPLLSVLSAVLVARWLRPEDYALMALGDIFVVTIGMVCELGLGSAIIQFQNVTDAELNTAFWLIVGSVAPAYVALYLAAPFIARFFGSSELTLLLRVLGLPAMLTVLRLVPENLLRKQLRLDRLSIAEVIAALTAIPLMVVLAWSGAGVWALVGGNAVTWLVHFLLLFAFSGWRPGWRVGSKRLAPILRYSGAVLCSRLLWALYAASDRAILGRVTGGASLGFFAMASQIALKPAERVSLIVNQLAGPLLANVQGDVQAMRTCLARSLRIVAWITLPMCVGTLLVAEDAVRVVLTEKWLPAVPVVQVLCIYAGLRSMTALLPPVLMAAYRTNVLVRFNLAMSLVMPLAFFAGAWWAGALGVAAAWTIMHPVGALVLARVTLHQLQMSWRSVARELQRPVLATTLTAIAMSGMSRATSLLGFHPGSRLTVAVLAGIAAYGACLWQLAGPELRDVALAWRTVRGQPVEWGDSARTVS